jgi:hypothetical protein
MAILEQATKINWGSQQANEQHFKSLLEQHCGFITAGGVVMEEIVKTEQF